ncbi:transposase (plasmid) [Coraliomargarita sp. W4R53]
MPSDDEALDAIAAELYELRPDCFTAARNTRAQACEPGLARKVKALPKPTVAAWAVNLIVRDGGLDEALTLAAALREAQHDLDARELARLAPQRRALVSALARAAVGMAEQAGVSVSTVAHSDIEKTINAAVMDADAATAALTGRLVRPMEAGAQQVSPEVVGGSFRPNSLDDAAAAAPIADDLAERRARKTAEQAAREAERAANEMARELSQVSIRREKVQQRADHLHERIDDLRGDLAKLESEASLVDSTLGDLDREQAESAKAARAAAKRAEQVRAAVDR